MLGLDVLDGDVLDVTVERGRHLAARHGVRMHIAELRDEHLVQVGRLLALSAARAVVDLARTSRLSDAVALGDCALRAGVTTTSRIEATLADAAGLRGVVAARAAVPLLDGRSESLNESRLRVAMHLDGLRDLDVQYDAYDEDGHVARADLHLEGVWIEYDGRRQRLEKTAFVGDRRRGSAVADLGHEVRRFTDQDVLGRSPASLGAEVRRALVLARPRDRSRVLRGPDTLPRPRQRPLATFAECAAAA